MKGNTPYPILLEEILSPIERMAMTRYLNCVFLNS